MCVTARYTFDNYRPGKAICDIAVMLTAGSDCPGDVAMLSLHRRCSR